MTLKLYNTLTRKIEEFKPLSKKEVKMYSCGPTVYDYAHIGNFRTNILTDILKRSLIFLGYKVNHAMNITDVDDKTIKGSTKEDLPLKEFTEKYTKIFFNEMQSLNILPANHIIKATESIPEMVNMIKILMEKGFAYKSTDGIYFSIVKDKSYGSLAQLEKSKDKRQRVKNDEYDKENAQDFALWKFYTSEDGEVYWQTELGKGRPGWHIECSAMTKKIFGDQLDIHLGGSDLIFPHHTNEIAQSECCNNKKFVNYWVHGGMLTMNESKMSKSKGNITRLEELKKINFSPMEYRYMCLTTHYRMPLQFNEDNLISAKNSYSRLKNIIIKMKDDGKENKKYLQEFKKSIEEDINMPKALAVLWELLRDEKATGKLSTIKEMDKIFGLKLLEKEEVTVPVGVKKLIEEREIARKNKDYKKSDELRIRIDGLGFIIKDTKEGYKLERNE
jgi:cysteinyl-tRNA synthetase